MLRGKIGRATGYLPPQQLPFLDLPFCDRYRAFEMLKSSVPLKNATSSALSATGTPLAASASAPKPVLYSYFDSLFAAYGPQHWWPGRTRFEIIVGAILTQNTSWKNVERAIANLRSAKLLSPAAIAKISPARLAAHLRPSGYFRQKTQTLKTFVSFLFEKYEGSLNSLFTTPTNVLREQLLALRGIGPETADSILLYAGDHPVFVVDAYSRRLLGRHGLLRPGAQGGSRRAYEQIRSLFESQLPRDPRLFNEFHALIVRTGKGHCRKTAPLCCSCPLSSFLPASSHPAIAIHEPRSVRCDRPVTFL
jgi:endonuclease-3 related protein